jgi:hypothetical protein
MKRALLLAATIPLIVSAAPQLAAEAISMRTSAWGSDIVRWRIAPNGSITYAVRKLVYPPARQGPWLERRTSPAPDRYRRIAELLSPARAWAGREMPCDHPITDQDSGTLSWGKGAKLDFYDGCHEPETKRLVALLFEAQKQLGSWTNTAPVTAVREEQAAS